MTGKSSLTHLRPRHVAALLAAVLAAMVASTGAAAERVVLGEYFTNLF